MPEVDPNNTPLRIRRCKNSNVTIEYIRDNVLFDTVNGCWLWLRGCRNGYGDIRIATQGAYVHRIMWELTYGAIPSNKWVLHKCDIRLCVNPTHLFLGDVIDNHMDMALKHRGSNGDLPYGVHLLKRKYKLKRPYHAQIQFLGKAFNGGCFETIAQAHLAALELRQKLYKEYTHETY